ncbi:MAG: hypothetical protein ACE5FQ_13845 [Thiogranum sp.]
MRAMIRKLVILIPLLNAGVIHSAEWKIDPAIQFEAGYNDNVRLSIDDKVSSTQASLSPSAVFSVETPRSRLDGNLRFDFRRYEESSNLDENNVRFNVNSFRRMERSQIGLNMGITKDTTLDSQLEDTGLVLGRVKRVRLNGGPNWAYNIDERTQASLSYNYSDVQYKNAGGTGLVDFRIHSAQTSLQRILNERITASTTLSYSQTDNDNDAESKNINLQGGASYRFSETLSASLFVGMRRTKTDFSQNSLIPIFSGDTVIGFIPLTQDVSNSSSGYTFSSSIDKSFLRGKTGITASQNISNSTNGAPVQVTRLGWDNQYRFTETLTTSLSAEYYSSETENSVNTNLNRDYYVIRPGVAWKFRKFWRISGHYRYRKQTFNNTGDAATQNVAYLTLTYDWPRIAASR